MRAMFMRGRSAWRRGRSAAFWSFSPASLEVAVLERCVGEPLVTACAALEARWLAGGDGPAAGIVELCAAVGAGRLAQVAALADEYCSLAAGHSGDGSSDRADADSPALVRVAVAGGEPFVCSADAVAVAHVRERFAAAGLRLQRLDCAPCARLALTAFLGAPAPSVLDYGAAGGEVATVFERTFTGAPRAAPLDPLAAVSVAPDCEDAAAALAARLAVPVGLALLWFGYVDRSGLAAALAAVGADSDSDSGRA
jgi:hypothetical protein